MKSFQSTKKTHKIIHALLRLKKRISAQIFLFSILLIEEKKREKQNNAESNNHTKWIEGIWKEKIALKSSTEEGIRVPLLSTNPT